MTSLFSHASKFVNTHRGNPPGDLNDVDLATDEDLTVFDLERLQLDEGGAVVGTTAVINGQQLTLSGGKLPPRYGISKCSCLTRTV